MHEALSYVNTKHVLNRMSIEYEYDFCENIGNSNCVRTNANDQIIYAQREGRKIYSRFVINRKAEPCSKIVAVLRQPTYSMERTYILLTAFIGSFREAEPVHRRTTGLFGGYWSTHAIVWGSEISYLVRNKICPW